MPVVNILRTPLLREIEIPGPHFINISYHEAKDKPKTTRMEWIELDLVYQAYTDRWFGVGLDLWMGLYYGLGCVKTEDGWNFMPAFKAFSFELLLGLPEPQIRRHTATQSEFVPASTNFRDPDAASWLPQKPEVICGPFDWLWPEKPPENYARVIGAFYREAPTVQIDHRR